jgi:hypothetical protein
MVNRSSSDCVGCSFIPSPAFITEAFTFLARRCGAPDIGCLMIITSAPIMSMVLPVSISVSPLDTLLLDADIFAALAPMYFDASSKDSLVLVLFS